MVGPFQAEIRDAVAPAQRVEGLDVVARGGGVEEEVRVGPLAGVQQAVHILEERADLLRRADRVRDAQGLGDGLDFHDVRNDAPELDEEAHTVHRLVDLEGLLGAVGDHPFALLLGRDDILHVLVNQFHVGDRGLHQAGLLLHALGRHLEGPGQLLCRNQIVRVHILLLIIVNFLQLLPAQP